MLGRQFLIAKRIFGTGESKKLPRKHWARAKVLLTIMYHTDSLEDLKLKGEPPALRLHFLTGDQRGRIAIDINKISGWRITFVFSNGEFYDVRIEDYH